MNNENKKVAIMYDFDKTLSTTNMQEYGMTDLVQESIPDFWKGANTYGKENNMDQILASMYWLVKVAKEKNIEITKNDIVKSGNNIVFYKGVTEWFKRINDYGKTLGLEVEHYIISSGMKECILGSTIAKEFKRIFACEYDYDKSGHILWPKQVVNYTAKTQYLYRVRKNALDNLYDGTEVNEHIDDSKVSIPFTRMVYIGDGNTDIPCMKMVKDNGGTSICVFEPSDTHAVLNSAKIKTDGRVNFVTPSDYSEGSLLDIYIKKVFNNIKTELDLLSMENK